jgi:hypothetical protein
VATRRAADRQGDLSLNDRFQVHLRRHGIRTAIPEPVDRQVHRARRGRRAGRPPNFEPKSYQRRHVVKRCSHEHKAFRDLAHANDKGEYLYRAASTSS